MAVFIERVSWLRFAVSFRDRRTLSARRPAPQPGKNPQDMFGPEQRIDAAGRAACPLHHPMIPV
jgi:hypothetical protein